MTQIKVKDESVLFPVLVQAKIVVNDLVTFCNHEVAEWEGADIDYLVCRACEHWYDGEEWEAY